jgi:hypothetical protein
VYRALELDYDPATTGSVEEDVASVEVEDLRNALLAELAAERELEQVPLEAETLEGARVFEGSHRIPQPTAGSE